MTRPAGDHARETYARRQSYARETGDVFLQNSLAAVGQSGSHQEVRWGNGGHVTIGGTALTSAQEERIAHLRNTYGDSNPGWFKRNAIHFRGAMKIGFATLMAKAAFVNGWNPLGVWLGARAVDLGVSGAEELFTGQDSRSLTNRALGMFMDREFADLAEVGIDILSLRAGTPASRAAPNPKVPSTTPKAGGLTFNPLSVLRNFGKAPPPTGALDMVLRERALSLAQGWWFQTRISVWSRITGRGRFDWKGFMEKLEKADYKQFASSVEAASGGWAGLVGDKWVMGIRNPTGWGSRLKIHHELTHFAQEHATGAMTRFATASGFTRLRMWAAAESGAWLVGTPLTGAVVNVTALGGAGTVVYAGGASLYYLGDYLRESLRGP